ncbi:hypothetical protein FSP39_010436 [Pinctada imbricata]|uniref:Uncharacterized protein n=1 Tax=Pinctada imbricata TaxID=66713 RepID=A0AA89C777_PINIB|nr:hypothetical protein FSP39_010436 [Pinctada imbricata]
MRTSCDDPGFDLLIGTSITDEVENHPITFDKPLPGWLKGSLIRNGPARYEMGNRRFLNLFDAFGKLNKWTFPGNGSAFFSAKFIGSHFYNDSVSEKDIADYMIFDTTLPPKSEEQVLLALERGMDNMNINVYNFTDGCVVLSDTWKLYKVDCETMATISAIKPSIRDDQIGLGYISVMSSAHPVPEVGTSNYFIFLTSMSLIPGIKHKISILRISSVDKREVVGTFEVEEAPYMHSFSATKNYIILFAHPYHIDILKMMETGTPKDSIQWHPDLPGMIYVMEIKTGKVFTLETETLFSMHHINAFETNDSQPIINVDVAAYPDDSLVDNFEVSIILNKAKRDSIQWQPKLVRFAINLLNLDVKVMRFPFGPNNAIASHLEIPAINEAYRSRPYCYAYGLVFRSDNKTFANFTFVKKDLCDSKCDKSWSIPGHYPMEGWFVPDPSGSAEDDGIIMVPVVNGVDRKSYLAFLDARNLTLINKSNTPFIVPFHFHGRFFPNLSN